MTSHIDEHLAAIVAIERALDEIDARRAQVDPDDFAERLNLKLERRSLEVRLAETRARALAEA